MKHLRHILAVVGLLILVVGCGNKDEGSEQEVIDTANEETTVEATEPEVIVEEPILEEATESVTEPVMEDIEEPAEEEIEVVDLTGLAINPLTGNYIPEEVAIRRPIGIMINNHNKAQPQSGLSQADIIYETLVEGGIARLFAVYKDFDAEKIGPVRSARHYYLDFSFDLDALYVHYGQSPQADVAFGTLNAPNMNGLSYLDTIMCFQDPDRVRPHSTYTSYEGLMDAWAREKYRTEYNEGFVNKFTFSNEVLELEDGGNATKVTLDYSYYQYAWFDYDEATTTYLRNQFGGAHIDVETGEQLAFDNIIIQIADLWKIAGDAEGRLDAALVSEGEGYYISHGKAIPITWSKSSHYDPTQYFTESGEILEMNTGKTWISVFPSYRLEGLIIE